MIISIRKYSKIWLVFSILLMFLFLLNISLGSIRIPLQEIFLAISGRETSNPVWIDIIWNFRLTKAITCVLAGGALSISGLQMQTLFRNPLAGPDVLGLTAGASLAVSLILMGGTRLDTEMLAFTGPWAIALAATVGCAVIIMMVLIIAKRLNDSASLLIIGLMIGAGTSSLVSVLQFLSSAEELQTYLIWTFGNVGGLSWQEISVLTIVFLTGGSIAYATSKAMNAWLLGDNYIRSIGIDLKRSRFLIIVSACLLTGGVTAFCGPVAFVGIAVPHLVKLLLTTNNHKILIPSVMMGGGILLLLCDILAQLPGSTQVLPINAITAIFGAPVVIWIVMRNRIVR